MCVLQMYGRIEVKATSVTIAIRTREGALVQMFCWLPVEPVRSP